MRALLVLVALALVTVLGLQWADWPPQPQEPRGGQPAEPTAGQTVPLENELDLLNTPAEKEEYAVVHERPLFTPNRRPPAEQSAEQEAPPEEESDLDRLDLNAVLITPVESSAWVRDPAKKELVRLRLGDDLVGWSVKEILTDRLVVERQEETDTLILRDYKKMPPPVAPRSKPTARKPPRTPPSAAKRPQSQVQLRETAKRPTTPPGRAARFPRKSRNAEPSE